MRACLLLLAFSLYSALWADGTVQVNVGKWTTLNPLLLAQDTDTEAVDLIFDRLVTVDAKGQFIPELLESWTILKEGREVLLKLRPGLIWQDGSPIEAEDLVFTWKTLRLPQVRRVADTVPGVVSLDSLEAEGPLTVRIRLRRPRGSLLADLYAFIPVPRHHYQMGADPSLAAINFAPVGSGPYRVAGKATTKFMHLERWTGYKGIHPGQAEAFEFKDLSDVQTPVIQDFQAERLHYSVVGSLRYYLARKGGRWSDLAHAYSVPLASFGAYFLNCDPKLSLLGDLRLRQTLAELVPWEDLARAKRFFPTRIATSFWPPESWAYDPTPRPLPRPERAAALLTAAGWVPGADGVRRDAKGRRLHLVAYDSAPPNPRSSARLLAKQAAQVGVEVEVRSVDNASLFGNAAKHVGDLWSFAWTLALDPDVDSPLFTSEGYRTGANVSSYLNPEMDRLFDEGRHTVDLQARKQVYQRISQLIYRDKPLIPTVYLQNRVLVARRLQGVAFGPLGQSFAFWPGRRAWKLVP